MTRLQAVSLSRIRIVALKTASVKSDAIPTLAPPDGFADEPSVFDNRGVNLAMENQPL
jgi:hypothetical protein